MKISVIFLTAFFFSVVTLSNLIYFTALNFKICAKRGYIFACFNNNLFKLIKIWNFLLKSVNFKFNFILNIKSFILPAHWHNSKSACQRSRRLVFNPWSSQRKDLKMVLDASLLNTQYYQVRIKGKCRLIKGKCNNPGKGVAPSPSLQRSSYWERSLRVTFDYGWPALLILLLRKWQEESNNLIRYWRCV